MPQLTAPMALAGALAVAGGIRNPDALSDGEWRNRVQEANRILAALREQGWHLSPMPT